MSAAMRADADTRRQSTWIEISAGAHASNLAFFRRLVGPAVELAAVVKANAYGHGLERAVRGLAEADGLALLDLAIRSDRHVAIREQLQQKSADVQKKVRALKRRVEPADVEDLYLGTSEVARNRIDVIRGLRPRRV